MALTLSRVKGAEFTMGRLRGYTFDVTFDSSYLTGGEILSADDVGMVNIVGAFCVGVRNAAGTAATTYNIPIYNPVTGSLQLMWGNAGTASVLPEVTSTTDVSGLTYTIVVIGF